LPADQPAAGQNRCPNDKEREDPADTAQAHGLDGLIAYADIVHGVFLPPPRLSFEHVRAKRKARRSKRHGLAMRGTATLAEVSRESCARSFKGN
jgi:hypothetical protein